MKIKNYVVYSDYTLEDNPAKSEIYGEMTKISIESCKRHLAGKYEIIVLNGMVKNHHAVFKRNWLSTYDLWHETPCNILFVDSDTVFMNTANFFNEWDNFRLFNYTDPKGDLNGKPYFNCGVRYFPAMMNDDLWDLYRRQSVKWNPDIWDYEQQSLNEILWHSKNGKLKLEDCYRPDLVYQTPWNCDQASNTWNNGVRWNEAGIIHYHGSRGVERIELARKLWEISREQ